MSIKTLQTAKRLHDHLRTLPEWDEVAPRVYVEDVIDLCEELLNPKRAFLPKFEDDDDV